MEFDKEKYKVYTWKHPLMLHWIINPGIAINEFFFGQVMAKVSLVDKTSDKPLFERSYVPCPHCNYIHNGLTWSAQNKTAAKNWFGLYCCNCDNIIPVLRNITTLLFLTITYPIWVCFKKPLKEYWLKQQPERYKNISLSSTKKANKTKTFIYMGLFWGVTMYLWMELLYPLIFNEPITQKDLIKGIPVWLIGGLIFGMVMKFWMNKKGTNTVEGK